MKKLLSLLALVASSSLVLAGCRGGSCGAVYVAPACATCPTEAVSDACPGACPEVDTAAYADACPGGCAAQEAAVTDGGCPTGLDKEALPAPAEKAAPMTTPVAAPKAEMPVPAAEKKATPAKAPVKEEQLDLAVADDKGDEAALEELEETEEAAA